MGSIFSNPTIRKPVSARQKNYFAEKKTDRKPKENHELRLQLQMCDWLRDVLPSGIHFTCDTASGAFNSKFEKTLHNRQQSSIHQPDMKIFASRRGYHGLMIELKRDGTKLRRTKDGTKIAVRRNGNGKIIERDYKIRKTGDWFNLHIENQANVMGQYVRQGYCAKFAVGETAFKKIVCWYFDIPYTETESLF